MLIFDKLHAKNFIFPKNAAIFAPAFRSLLCINECIKINEKHVVISPGWWNGRHEGLKILWPHGCAGSSPASGTNYGEKPW